MKQIQKTKQKSSIFRGVCWSEREERWIMQIRKAGLQRICHSEIEAAACYNASASRIWPDRELNDLTLIRNNISYNIKGERVIDLTGGREVIVDDDEAALNHFGLGNHHIFGFFYRKGRVQSVHFNQKDNKLEFLDLGELIYGEPVNFRNGDCLDCREENLFPANLKCEPGSGVVVRPLCPEYLDSLKKLTIATPTRVLPSVAR
jgi:hypothetical protein